MPASGATPKVAVGLVVAFAILAVLAFVPVFASADASAPTRSDRRLHEVAAKDKPLVVPRRKAAPESRGHIDSTKAKPAVGLVYKGLKKSDTCSGGYQLDTTKGQCTHGPDQIPGVATRTTPTTDELYEAAASFGTPGTSATGSVPCYGDGSSGTRVQTVYAVASDKTDRFTSLLELFPQYVATADAVFNNTAEQGGAIRHVRWATTASCKLDVMHVVLSSTGDDSLTAMRSELIALGLNRNDRKYLVWVDASVYCGIANVTNDDSPGVTNKANTGPHFARVDAPCWGSANSLEAHEILHSLGAVQLSAPHTTGAWHCSDEYDRMCYNDGSGVPLTYDCAYAWESLFDCGSNDYFAINPADDSYLATHWNVANSTFLATTAPGSTPSPSPTPTTPTTTASPSPTPGSSSPTPTTTPTTTPTSEPTPTATPERVLKVKQGRLTQKAPGRFYSFRTSGGGAWARLTFKGEQSLRVKFVNQLGQIVASRVATSGFALSPALSAGRYVVTVGRSTSATFTLRWRYWAVPG